MSAKEDFWKNYEFDVYTRVCRRCDDYLYQADNYDDPLVGGPWAQEQCPMCYDGPVVELKPQRFIGPLARNAGVPPWMVQAIA